MIGLDGGQLKCNDVDSSAILQHTNYNNVNANVANGVTTKTQNVFHVSVAPVNILASLDPYPIRAQPVAAPPPGAYYKPIIVIHSTQWEDSTT